MTVHPYLGTNVDPASVKELHHRGLLQEGEILLAIFDGVLIDERGRRVGGISLSDFVALTDQRLITWARGFFNDTVDGFSWKNVDVIEAKSWDPLHGRVSLAFRLLPSVPRPRRISVKGFKGNQDVPQEERIIINSLDYMPAADVAVLTEMVEWIGDQVVAGITSEELFAAFMDTFPVPESEPVPPQQYPPPPQPPTLETKTQNQRPWWSGKNKEPEKSDVPIDTPDRLIAAYELQRGDGGSYQGAPSASSGRGFGPAPTAFGQFGFYDVSRGMRLLFEGPRRVGVSLNRVNDMLLDTAEVIEELQDPQARKRTISGLRMAMDMQEQQSGLLGAVAPVVRAVLGPSDQEKRAESGGGGGGGDRANVRRIQVRAAVRKREAASRQADEMRADMPPQQETPPSMSREASIRGEDDSHVPVVSAKAKVRRKVVTRKTDDSADVNGTGEGNASVENTVPSEMQAHVSESRYNEGE